MVNSSVCYWSDTTCRSGPMSWIRISIAMIPAQRKNEVIR